MTAPAHQGVTTAGDSNGAGITGVTRPTTTNGHVHIFDLYYESAGVPTGNVTFSNGTWVLVDPPGGVVQTGTTPDYHHARWYSIHNSEASTFNVTFSGVIGSVWRTACVNTYSGVDNTTVQDAASTGQASAGSSTSATAPGLTTVTADALVVYAESDNNGKNVTPPAGTTPTFTERTDFGNLEVADGALATAQATGDKTGTVAAGGDFNTASLMALRPAVPGGAADTPELRGRPYGLRGGRLLHQILAH